MFLLYFEDERDGQTFDYRPRPLTNYSLVAAIGHDQSTEHHLSHGNNYIFISVVMW